MVYLAKSMESASIFYDYIHALVKITTGAWTKEEILYKLQCSSQNGGDAGTDTVTLDEINFSNQKQDAHTVGFACGLYLCCQDDKPHEMEEKSK